MLKRFDIPENALHVVSNSSASNLMQELCALNRVDSLKHGGPA